MSLNRTLFREQMECLAVFYPTDRVEITDKMIKAWWPVFKDFNTGDFISGVIACRSESRRFPSLGVLQGFVETARRAKAREELSDRIQSHEQSKVEERQFCNPGSQSPKGESLQSQSLACFRAIMEGITFGKKAGIKAMKSVADRYPRNEAGIMRCAHEIGMWEE